LGRSLKTTTPFIMSLLKGIQSAVFYYVSCAPCTKLTYRRKRKAEATRARQLGRAMEDQEPGLYPHPSPFSTNIYWHEEMALGPGPPMKKGGKEKGSRTGSRRELATAGQGSSLGSSADTTIVAEGGSPGLDESRLSSEGWNRRRYQREDEELWGYDDSDAGGFEGVGEGRRGSSIGPAGLGKAGNATPYRYYLARNPAVNDLHPPVVSTQPAHKSETRWMLQPPPSAKIMEGKVRANRSRSGSGGSSRRGGEAVSLGRRVGERLMEEKVKRGEIPPTGACLSISMKKSRESDVGDVERDHEGQPHDRNTRRSIESAASTTSRRRKQPPPMLTSEELRPPAPAILASLPPSSVFESQSSLHRPPSFTNPSSSFTNPTRLEPPSPTPQFVAASTYQPHHGQPSLKFTESSDSLDQLQELTSSTTANTISSDPSFSLRSVRGNREVRDRLPPSTCQEEAESAQLPGCETWFPLRDFRFPTKGPSQGLSQSRPTPELRSVTQWRSTSI